MRGASLKSRQPAVARQQPTQCLAPLLTIPCWFLVGAKKTEFSSRFARARRPSPFTLATRDVYIVLMAVQQRSWRILLSFFAPSQPTCVYSLSRIEQRFPDSFHRFLDILHRWPTQYHPPSTAPRAMKAPGIAPRKKKGGTRGRFSKTDSKTQVLRPQT